VQNEDTEYGWTVHIETERQHLDTVPDEIVDEFIELMQEYGGTVSIGEGGYGATFSIRERDGAGSCLSAAEAGQDAIFRAAKQAGLPIIPLRVLDVRTFAVHDVELEQPAIPELVSVSEIADILGVSRQRAHQLTKRPDFPEPIARLGAGPVWTRPSLNLFVERWRGDKPDMSKELNEIDAVLVGVKAMRNRVAHGEVDSRILKDLTEWVALSNRLVAIEDLTHMVKELSADDDQSVDARSSRSV
jgi:hypothetical protein